MARRQINPGETQAPPDKGMELTTFRLQLIPNVIQTDGMSSIERDMNRYLFHEFAVNKRRAPKNYPLEVPRRYPRSDCVVVFDFPVTFTSKRTIHGSNRKR